MCHTRVKKMKMKLEFRNIGKISEAEIEANSITVIAGNNDTGKSTVGKLSNSFEFNNSVISAYTEI